MTLDQIEGLEDYDRLMVVVVKIARSLGRPCLAPTYRVNLQLQVHSSTWDLSCPTKMEKNMNVHIRGTRWVGKERNPNSSVNHCCTH